VRADFEGLDNLTHLAAGGEAPPLKTQAAAMLRWAGFKGRGSDGRADRNDTLARVKANGAQVFGVTADEIALTSSAGEAMSQVALSVPLEAGDNVVLQDVEFRSASLPWVGLRRRGVEIRVIRHADWTPDERAFREAADSRTRAIVTSQVNYLTGIQHNLEALRAIADQSGAVLAVDATHAAGAVPVPGRLCDFAITATYKWILGCQGVALLAWNRERVPELAPAISGWRSAGDWQDDAGPLEVEWKPTAERLEPGNPPWPSVFFFDEGLRYITAMGVDRIAAHIAPLSAEVNARLLRMELDVATPADPAYRAGNTCFWTPDPEGLADRMYREDQVLVSGYSGRIRISTHLYNDLDDVDRLFVALERALGVAVR
jgi:cysteine desulfurase / selenocysteine lyase